LRFYYIIQGILWLLIMVCVLMTQGCAVYTAVSATSYVATGKSVGDHVSSTATQADCNAVKYGTGGQDYYCEVPREPGTTYNRNAF
jgi:hypothetical protein